jgi:hypothetical protein
MLTPSLQVFAESERAYRQERVAAGYRHSRSPRHLKWPVGLLSPKRRQPRTPPRNLPAPHHATTIG